MAQNIDLLIFNTFVELVVFLMTRYFRGPYVSKMPHDISA